MMGLHAVQAVMEEAYSVEDVLALVQHDALGADARGSIGDLGLSSTCVASSPRATMIPAG